MKEEEGRKRKGKKGEEKRKEKEATLDHQIRTLGLRRTFSRTCRIARA